MVARSAIIRVKYFTESPSTTGGNWGPAVGKNYQVSALWGGLASVLVSVVVVVVAVVLLPLQ